MLWLSFALLAMALNSSFLHAEESFSAKQALFLIHRGQTSAALDIYEKHVQVAQQHETEFLQQLGLSLLEQGSRSQDPEVQLLTLFGAGIALNEEALPILARALSSPIMPLQMIALSFIGRYQDDEADRYLVHALQSNYILVRLEALHQMALRKHLKASCHIESLMGKIDSSLWSLFPPLLGLIGDADSLRLIKKLLNHSDENVRIAAIKSCASFGRDDLSQKIRLLAAQASSAQQEAAAIALGELKDESAIPLLHRLTKAPQLPVRLAALTSLYEMGRQEALEDIKYYAKNGDLFAINLLGEIANCEDFLFSILSSSQDFTVKSNTAIALLKQKDNRCLPIISELLIKDSRDLVFTKVLSNGKRLSYWKGVPSARQQFSDSQVELEMSLHFREILLSEAAELPEENFLYLVELVFERQQNDLVPVVIELLEDLQTEKAIHLLKKYQQKPGAPLIRNYSNLALYRLGESGAYGNNLTVWLEQQIKENLIQLRPYVPWELDDEHALYQITPHETSRLLVETFEAFTQKQDNNGINCLLKAIKNGNHKNKYALAGLLIRATL